MKVGDLVKIVNAWTGYNQWLEFPNEEITIGLVVDACSQNRRAIVLVEGERKVLPYRQLVVICK